MAPAAHLWCHGHPPAFRYVPQQLCRLVALRQTSPPPKFWQQRCHKLRTCHTQAAAGEAGTAQLPPALEKIVSLFKMVPDPKLKYQQLLQYAKDLPLLDQQFHTDDHKVRGCVSQVWVIGKVDDHGNLTWKADSDSALTKGLAALLVRGLSGVPPETVVKMDPNWISQMGLQQSLTPSRNNGFLNMFKLMQQKSLEMVVAKDKEGRAAVSTPSAESSSQSAVPVASHPQEATGASSAELPGPSSNGHSPPPSSTSPVRDGMDGKLRAALQPSQLKIIDESAKHAHHAAMKTGHASKSGETHFRVQVVSSKFAGLNTMQRHRLVYQVLKDELAGPVHALSLDTKVPEEAGS